MSNQYYWTKDEENFLKENYNKIPAKKLHKILHKSEQAIWSKASKLGLSKMIVPRTMSCKKECKELKAKLEKIKERIELYTDWYEGTPYECINRIKEIIEGAEDER